MALSIEPSGFDSSVEAFVTNNGFDAGALDLIEDGGSRTSVREGFSYYSGFPAATRPSSVPTGERRRFVILNGQPGENQWEILHISANFSSSQETAIRSLVDSVMPSSTEPDSATVSVVVSPPGAGSVSGAGTFELGTEVSLTFTANPGFRFVQWQGGVNNATAEVGTLTASSNTTVTAVFQRQWELSLESGAGGTVSGAGFFDDGATVSVTAQADEGYRFDGWQGNGLLDPTSLTTTLILTQNESVTARFVRVWELAVEADEGGMITTGAGTFDNGDTVSISASVAEGYRFAGWIGEGVADPASLETEVVLTADTMVRASFVRVWALTVAGAEGGTVSGAGTFDEGASVSISATLEEGYRFAGWIGEGVADPASLETEVVLTTDTTVSASFVKVWELTVAGGEGGTVLGGGTFDEGTVASISATLEEGYRFAGWGGEGIVDPASLETEVVLSAAVSVQANFVKVWTLTVSAGEGGTATGAGVYDEGASIAIFAEPAEGYRFDRWEGDGIVDTASIETEVVVNAETTVEAFFVKVWDLTIASSEGGSVLGAGRFDEGMSASITALPSPGFTFLRWEGSDQIAVPTDAETEVTLIAATTIMAVFEQVQVDSDIDSDGLPNEWELTHGLDPEDAADALLDSDRDGESNLEEFVALTDPTDPQSRLRIMNIVEEPEGLRIQWSSEGNVRYIIEAASDLSSNWLQVGDLVADGDSSEIVEIDLQSGPYYRVRVIGRE